MKKGRHRRFEEARALKRSSDLDINDIFDSLSNDDTSPSSSTEEPEENFEDDPYDPYSEDKWS